MLEKMILTQNEEIHIQITLEHKGHVALGVFMKMPLQIQSLLQNQDNTTLRTSQAAICEAVIELICINVVANRKPPEREYILYTWRTVQLFLSLLISP